MKAMYQSEIIENKRIAEGVYDMWLACEAAQTAVPGQFAAVYTDNPATLLPRPLSICEIADGRLRIVYRIAGQGTLELSQMQAGRVLRVLAPLGNGFDLSHKYTNIGIVGGGIGVPPLLELAKQTRQRHPDIKITAYLGFRDAAAVILQDDFAKYTDAVRVSTDDGSYGEHRNAISMLGGAKHDVVYACGPHVMLAGLAKWSAEHDTACYVSLEERMACCVGACLACIVKIKQNGGETQEKVCSTGPVFDAKELIWS